MDKNNEGIHHLYEYIKPITIDQELLCKWCKNPLNDPIILKCGHMICNHCISEYNPSLEENNNHCCECINISSNIPKYIYEILDNLNVVCLRCGSEIKKKDFKNHLQYQCRAKCEMGCGKFLLKSEINEHSLVCKNFICQCSARKFKCNWEGPRKELKTHQNSCSFVELQPKFEEITEQNEYLLKMLAESNEKIERNHKQFEESKEFIINSLSNYFLSKNYEDNQTKLLECYDPDSAKDNIEEI